MAVKPIPDGYPTVTPYLAVNDAAKVLEFAKQVFGAAPRGGIMQGPDGKIGHAELTIGTSLVMLGDVSMSDDPTPRPAMLHVYVEDCDTVYARALEAGGTSVREPAMQFYGDRTAAVRDVGGNLWYMATHVEDVTPDEMARRMKEMGM